MALETTQNAPRMVGVAALRSHARWRMHWLATPDQQRAGTFSEMAVGTTIIGRDPTGAADAVRGVQVADIALSRQHVALTMRQGAESIDVADLESRNGTAVDGQLAQPRLAAQSGSLVRCGSTLLLLELQSESPDSKPTAAIPGHSAAAQRMRAQLQAAASDSRPVLISGETGTGKEMAAAAVHQLSGRKGPLLRLNVSAVPESLFESELFGHAKGAFSGAGEARVGWVQQAHGGTLVLDEIGDLPLPLQAKLLRVIEDRQLRPLGAKADVQVDVRFVASTNADLAKRIRAGAFRQDLAARLLAHWVQLAPLRERRADLFDLADAAVARPASEGPWRCWFTADAAEALALYAWPDNMRELDRVLRRLLGVARPVGMLELPLEVIGAAGSIGRAGPVPLAEREAPTRERLLAALQASGGNVEQAARALGRDRKQVYRWMEAHGVDAAELGRLRA